MIRRGTRKKTPSQATPGTIRTTPPSRSRRRTPSARRTASCGAGGSAAAVPAVTARRRSGTSPSRLQGVPALGVLVLVETELEQLDELVEQGDVGIDRRVLEDLLLDVLHRR